MILAGIIATVFGLAFAIGQAADGLATPELKNEINETLSRIRGTTWHKAVAEYGYLTFCRIFGSSEKGVLKRSVPIYVVLTIFCLTFLYLFFPATFIGMVSVWDFSGTGSKATWLMLYILCGITYSFSNWQTYYFLRILRESPDFLRMILVAYADFLVTLTLTAAFVGSTAFLYSYVRINEVDDKLNISLDFTQIFHSKSIDQLINLGAIVNDKTMNTVINELDKIIYYEIPLTVNPSETESAMYRSDYSAIVLGIKGGYISGVVGSDGTIKFLDKRGAVESFKGPLKTYNDVIGTIDIRDNTPLETKRQEFCNKLSEGIPPKWGGFTVIYVSSQQRDALRSDCLAKRRSQLTLDAKFNVKNVDWLSMFTTITSEEVADLINSAFNGFNTYFTVTPFNMLGVPGKPEIPMSLWKIKPMMSDVKDKENIIFDEGVLEGLLFRNGAQDAIVGNSYPGGTFNVVLMSTSVFLTLLLLVMMISWPIVYLIDLISRSSRFIMVKDKPFSVILLTLSVPVSVLSAVVVLL